MEGVQKVALKARWKSSSCYDELLEVAEIKPLVEWRTELNQRLLYKVIHNLCFRVSIWFVGTPL